MTEKNKTAPLSAEYSGDFLIKKGEKGKNSLVIEDKQIIKELPKKQEAKLSNEYDGDFIIKPKQNETPILEKKEEAINSVKQTEKIPFELQNLEDIYASSTELQQTQPELNKPASFFPIALLGLGIIVTIGMIIAKSK